jgi:hypothetical protein
MALKMKQSIGAGGLVRARPVLPLGLRPRLAAVSHLQQFGRTGRIAQLLRAAAEEVETETFDVSWGSADAPGDNQDPSSSSGNSTCTSGVLHGLQGLLQLQPRCTEQMSHSVASPSQQACRTASERPRIRHMPAAVAQTQDRVRMQAATAGGNQRCHSLLVCSFFGTVVVLACQRGPGRSSCRCAPAR